MRGAFAGRLRGVCGAFAGHAQNKRQERGTMSKHELRARAMKLAQGYLNYPQSVMLRDAIVALFDDLLAQQEALVAALRTIVDMEPEPFDFPADWSQQVAACEECKRWKNHPIQLGICDTHRQAFWDRDAHEKSEQLRLHYRMRSVAREALATLQEAREPADALMKAEREIRSLDVDADARRLAALHQLIAWWDDTSWGSPRWIAELAAIVENCRAAAMAADTQTPNTED